MLKALQHGVVDEVQVKLEEPLAEVHKVRERASAQTERMDSPHVQQAAHTNTHQHANDPPPPQSYLIMAKKTAIPRATATITNGALLRVYIKYWRQDPVGAVKIALRTAIAMRVQQSNMAVEDDVAPTEVIPDIDAVRHLNQFGSPENPVMEVACTPEKEDLVRTLFKESNIDLLTDDLNPLLDPDLGVPVTDTSTTAIKHHVGHSTTVRAAWWKATHYLKNRDTSTYYNNISSKIFQSPTSLYPWPAHVAGSIIDATAVTEAKENPNIASEYEEGYETLATTQRRDNTKVTTRSFSTGVTTPPKQATKRYRAEATNKQTNDQYEDQVERIIQGLVAVDVIMTPSNTTNQTTHMHSTLGRQTTGRA